MNIKIIIKGISFFMIIGVLFTSCEDDDTVANETLLDIPTQLVVEFTDNNDQIVVLETGSVVSYTIGLTSPLTFDAILTFKVVSSDGSLESNPGFPEVSYNSEITFAAGDTSAGIDLTFLNDDINELSENYTITIDNLASANGEDFDANLYITDGEDNSRTVEVVDFINTGDTTISMTWTTGQDNDLILFEGNQDTINPLDFGMTASLEEEVTLSGEELLGEYSLWMEQWPSFISNVNYTITVSSPNSPDEVFSGTATSDRFIGVIEKTIDANNIPVYTVTQL